MTWRNWSGSVTAHPTHLHHPSTEAELVALVQTAAQTGQNIRMVGSGHSFTPVAATDATMISLQNYQGLVKIDAETQQATLYAGTTIKAAGELLHQHGLAMQNLGDIDAQSLAGAISTGTHGTGTGFGNIPSQMVGLRLITASGEILDISKDATPELFRAAGVSLGALGIISTVTLQCVPAYKLAYEWHRETLSHTLERLDEYKTGNRNFEFYAMPHTQMCMVKTMNESNAPVNAQNWGRRFNDVVLENAVYGLLCEASRLVPAFTRPVAKLSAALWSGGEDINHAHKVYATVRAVKFNEMEYNIPAAHFTDVLTEIMQTIEEERIRVHFPIECRFSAPDDFYISPASSRESAYIAVHQYKGMDYADFFARIEAIFKAADGRPHWGKLHTRTRDDLVPAYPQWEAFQTQRRQLDPDGRFINPHLDALFC